MKKRKFWLGMLVIALAFGMMVVGCDKDSTNENGGSVVDSKYMGTYKYFAYSGTNSLTTTTYTYIITANKAEYTVSSNGVINTNTIYDDAWTEGQELWVRGNNTRSLIGTFDVNGNTFTAGSRVYTKGNVTYNLNGTWSSSSYKYYFSGSNERGSYVYYQSNNPYHKGIYTTGGNRMDITITDMNKSRVSSYIGSSSSQEWYTRNELKTAYNNYSQSLGHSGSSLNTRLESFETTLNSLYTTSNVIYALSNTLLLNGISYTKE